MTTHKREVFKKNILLAIHYNYAQVYVLFPSSGHFGYCNCSSQQNPVEFSTPGQEL